ncbi:MAG: PEP-CTERM sorting domain-containing protein [Candidatus Omnitrophica bacterium]|nr:PEP-CTERM sorting domain-containing protein [Candidatus Omnitrophota bacterium]
MIRRVLAAGALSAVLLLAGSTRAEALILTFDLDKHPNDGQAFHPVGGTDDFDFVNAQMLVDTSTGKANLSGTVVHVNSSELWGFSGMFDGIGSSGTFWNSLPPVPFDAMFDELLTNGDNNARIFYQEAEFAITPTVVNPTYTGARAWVNNTNNLPQYGGEDLDIHRRVIGQPGQPYLVIESGWWQVTNDPDTNGDRSHGNWRWIMQEPSPPPPPPIPEPATGLLFGLGSLAGLLARRKRRT